MKSKMQDTQLRQYFILLFFILLLSSGCGKTMYKLSGMKTPRVENAASVLNFVETDFIKLGQQIYVSKFPLDTMEYTISIESITNQFFDNQGRELRAKNNDQDVSRFLHYAKDKDSLSKYYTIVDTSVYNLSRWGQSFQQLDGQPISLTIFASSEYTIVIPWMIYAYKAMYKEDFQKLQTIIASHPFKLSVLQLNLDFNEAWGLPLGAKVPVKTSLNLKDRSIEAKYNILPLLQKKGPD